MVECQLPKLNVAGSTPVPRLISLHFLQRISFLFFLMGAAMVALSGCVSSHSLPAESRISTRGKGVYHKVHPGETLWRIAKNYNVNIDQLIKENNIPNVAAIEKDQLIFIPEAEAVIDIALPSTLSAPEADRDFVWPIKGQVISYFGQKSSSGANNGIDISAHEGANVLAARSGLVIFADYLSGYGYVLILDHRDGFLTTYAQNARLLVKLNDVVNKGSAVAQVGKNGRLAYLHFEIRRNEKADNPLYYLP